MKANEFVKKYGICYAKKFDFSIWRKHKDEIDFDEDNLIRLIEAHELVESYGWLHSAKNILKLLESSLQIGLYHGIDGVNAETETQKLKQAIADVESCQ